MRLIYTFILLFILPSFAQVNVITTIKPLADIVKEVGKDKVIVEYLIPPNVNFHLYEYKPQDVKKSL